jgi:hypothetical protein
MAPAVATPRELNKKDGKALEHLAAKVRAEK